MKACLLIVALIFPISAMSDLNFGSMNRNSIILNTATTVGLRAAYEDFEKSGQDLNNFEVHIRDVKASKEDATDEENFISVAFVAKFIQGKRGLGNANRLGESINYLISPEDGKIVKIYGTK
ncbi:hypothetical protein [Burkholderia sp. Tr-20390]|uniref:hypothetical protein n=1 Tax=Burkholderia sp. Tr-20390 TaxID=2703904 RepID=UPI001F12231E|nr:hypothetical protein [Burkholderia sp. Tr-20390]